MTKFNMGKNIIKPIFIFIILSPSFVKFSYNLTVAIFTLLVWEDLCLHVNFFHFRISTRTQNLDKLWHGFTFLWDLSCYL